MSKANEIHLEDDLAEIIELLNMKRPKRLKDYREEITSEKILGAMTDEWRDKLICMANVRVLMKTMNLPEIIRGKSLYRKIKAIIMISSYGASYMTKVKYLSKLENK